MAARILLLALLLAAPAVAPAAEPARPDHPSQLEFEPLDFEIPKTVRKTLPNGMVVHFREDHELPLVTVGQCGIRSRRFRTACSLRVPLRCRPRPLRRASANRPRPG